MGGGGDGQGPAAPPGQGAKPGLTQGMPVLEPAQGGDAASCRARGCLALCPVFALSLSPDVSRCLLLPGFLWHLPAGGPVRLHCHP